MFLVLISAGGWVDSWATVRRIKSMKNLNDHTRNRTRDLSACSAVPQPTAPPCTFILEAQYTVPQKKNENTIPNGLGSQFRVSSESRKLAFRDSWSSPYQLNICQKRSVVIADITLSKRCSIKLFASRFKLKSSDYYSYMEAITLIRRPQE
jgi:hypothetical protein